MEHITAFSAVSLIPVGEAESLTPNCPATFQLCQTGSDSEGLALLAIATVTANSQQDSLSCSGQWRPTPWHLRRSRPVSSFRETFMSDGRAASTSELSAYMDNRADWAATWLARLRPPEWMNEWMNEWTRINVSNRIRRSSYLFMGRYIQSSYQQID